MEVYTQEVQFDYCFHRVLTHIQMTCVGQDYQQFKNSYMESSSQEMVNE